MTIVQITKNRIMKAIKTEPIKTFKPGAFVLDLDGNRTHGNCKITVKDKDCTVCAVGAVLRSVLDKDQPFYKIYNAANSSTSNDPGVIGYFYDLKRQMEDTGEKTLLKQLTVNAKEKIQRSPMTALSYFFEGLCEIKTEDYGLIGGNDLNLNQLNGIRRTVLCFVRDNFPKTVTIDIDGAKPAKDVMVVSKK